MASTLDKVLAWPGTLPAFFLGFSRERFLKCLKKNRVISLSFKNSTSHWSSNWQMFHEDSPACWFASPGLCLWLVGLLPANGVAGSAEPVPIDLSDSEPGLDRHVKESKLDNRTHYFSSPVFEAGLYFCILHICRDCWIFRNTTRKQTSFSKSRFQLVLTIGGCINVVGLLQPCWNLAGHPRVWGNSMSGASHLWLVHWGWAGIVRRLQDQTGHSC